MASLTLQIGKKIKDCSSPVKASLDRDEFFHILLVRGLTGMESVKNHWSY